MLVRTGLSIFTQGFLVVPWFKLVPPASPTHLYLKPILKSKMLDYNTLSSGAPVKQDPHKTFQEACDTANNINDNSPSDMSW